jgi:hypothetical protein
LLAPWSLFTASTWWIWVLPASKLSVEAAIYRAARSAPAPRLHARAMDVGLLTRGASQRAIPVRARVEMLLIVLAGDRTADRAPPAVRGSAAPRTERCRGLGHHDL